MGRPKEERYWNQVTKEADRTWKCKRCGRQFSGGASRIKAHVDRIREKWPAAEDDDHGMVDASFGGLMDHSINITEPMNLDER
ncbi:uncharacterized protein DS421_14g481900 [Arachis hypogaea]|uniref:BED-type domain-containing protein n=1 Tax=Arachis hypogaea TaxID=3818 RepID=A0A444WP32_ARAHY|nr:uncharacterized protein DS421_14g481900 [Arachis hypogaea]RYQ78988.1 hypothetical protein Ahy_Scaffold8g108472 [Arachis hypogaea]